IRIQLVADNGTPLNPDVSSTVDVVATQGPAGGVPRVEILSPGPLESTGHGTYVSYRIENFTLVEPRGQPNAPNEGHVQLLVGTDVVMEAIQYEPVLLVSLPEGDITITVRLVNNDNTALSPDASEGRAAPSPTLSIVSPTPNAVIGNRTPVVVVFAVTNFNLTDSTNGTSSPNSGHVDVFVDGALAATASVNTIVLALPSGAHGVRLQLVAINGSALSPDVTASVAVVVTRGPAGGIPVLSIVVPRDGALVGTDFTVSFRVTNFVLVAPGRPAGVPNEGHVRVG